MLEDEANVITVGTEDDDPILPEGWAGEDDIFTPEEWSGGDAPTDEPGPKADPEPEEDPTADDGAAPTTEPADESGDLSDAPAEAPTTEPESGVAASRKFKVPAKIDHRETVVEVGEEDLPDLVQKSAVTERVQARLKEVSPIMARLEQKAKAKGFESAQAMLDADDDAEVAEYVEKGVPEEIARDFIKRRAQSTEPVIQKEEPPAITPPAAPKRDFTAEVADLCAVYPEMRGKQVPDAVVQATIKGKPLIQAYSDYRVQQAESKAAALSKENSVLKQNAASAAKAPVKGVTGGGKTDTEPESDFLKGFNSDTW